MFFIFSYYKVLQSTLELLQYTCGGLGHVSLLQRLIAGHAWPPHHPTGGAKHLWCSHQPHLLWSCPSTPASSSAWACGGGPNIIWYFMLSSFTVPFFPVLQLQKETFRKCQGWGHPPHCLGEDRPVCIIENPNLGYNILLICPLSNRYKSWE